MKRNRYFGLLLVLLFTPVVLEASLGVKLENEDRFLVGEEISRDELENTYAGYGISNTTHRSKLWPNGIIPYYIEPELREEEPGLARQIQNGMKTWRTETGGVIRFVEYRDESSFESNRLTRYSVGCRIGLRESGTNAAFVGVRDSTESCVFFKATATTRTVLHELGHVIGLYHEHCRNDRDPYIKVNWDEIEDFQNSTSGSAFGRGRVEGKIYLNYFDWDSIMLYPSKSFSKNGKDTLNKRDGKGRWGMNVKLSRGDIQTVKAMYRAIPKSKPKPRDSDYGPYHQEIKDRLDFWKKHGRF